MRGRGKFFFGALEIRKMCYTFAMKEKSTLQTLAVIAVIVMATLVIRGDIANNAAVIEAITSAAERDKR